MNRKVKSFMTHQALFIKGWGSLGNYMPSAGRTIKGLFMEDTGLGVYVEGPNQENPSEVVSAFIPYGNIAFLIYETDK